MAKTAGSAMTGMTHLDLNVFLIGGLHNKLINIGSKRLAGQQKQMGCKSGLPDEIFSNS
jgi:hypothetical protein